MASIPSVVALIPARGGSKSVPRKNVLPIAGKPLIAYSIEHAFSSACINRVIVSTDDAEIAEVAREYGAEVPFKRPAELATDSATDLVVFEHALNWLWEQEGQLPELVVHLRATSPVRRPEVIDEAIVRMLNTPDADALRSVGLADQTPYKMWKIVDGELKPVLTIAGVRDAHSMPRQQLPPVYWQNGYVDIIRPRAVLEYGSMTGKKVIPFVVQAGVDLDYPEQVPAIEAAVRGVQGESRSALAVGGAVLRYEGDPCRYPA